jgi:hypothetical protein
MGVLYVNSGQEQLFVICSAARVMHQTCLYYSVFYSEGCAIQNVANATLGHHLCIFMYLRVFILDDLLERGNE